MVMLKIAGIILGCFVIVVFLFLAYMGVFSDLKVVEKETGPFTIVYESFVGPYSQSGQVFDRVYKALKSEGLETKRGLGIYYDNPAVVPADQLRSDCGVIIEENELSLLEKIKDKYHVKTLQKEKRMIIEFPKKNMLSYMIGPMKAYPKFSKYSKEKGYNDSTLGFEIYDETQKKIIFMMNIQ